jgi:hypothetical protein
MRRRTMVYDLRDSFLEAAQRLPKEIGRKIWKCLRSLARSPDVSGLNLERLGGRAEPYWSIRVDEKYRAILLRDDNMTTLVFVGTHDDAYRFANRTPAPDRAVMGGSSVKTAPEPPTTPPAPSAPREEPVKTASRTAKYVPLTRHVLNAGPASSTVRITFVELETMLGASLPASARRHRSWWGNDSSGRHVQATAWLSIG